MRAWLCCSLFLVASCGGPITMDDASTDAPHDAAPECRADGDCDDGLFCDGVEHCVSSHCTSGTPMRCEDTVACTVDSCSETTRACVHRVPDADGDGAGAASCVDATGTPLGTDCDDTDPDRFPTHLERCDAAMHDEDCDDTTHGGVDADGDGFEDHRCCNGTHCGDDCDDGHASAHPGATEACNLVDDDCDGMVDDGVATAGFVDADRDGFGNASMPLSACSSAPGFSADGTDCDDTNAARNPAQAEFCDGIDNDCNTLIDDGASNVTWYRDTDGDGFGSASSGTTSACAPPVGYALRNTDCNDHAAAVSPAAPELCNAIDDDCNGAPDYVIAVGNLEDDDRDGIADLGCGLPLGTDCDDHDATSGPGTVEACDGRDNDCDGHVDEGASETAFYRDADGDGFGDDRNVRVGCTPPSGFVRRGGDCDDTMPTRSPAALESCDGFDQDCDGATDEAPATTSCTSTSGTVMACIGGACTATGCSVGFGDCVSTVSGCETNLATDGDHCGSCLGCSEPLSSCSAGACRPLLGGLTSIDQATGTGDVQVERVLTVPASTDYIVLGRFSGTIHLGGTVYTSAGGYDGFAARMRRNGTAVWVGQWGGTGDDAIHAAAMTPDGAAFVVGGEMCNGILCSGPLSGCYGFWQRFPSAAAGGCPYASGVTGTTAAIRALAMERVGTTYYVYAAGTFSGTGSSGLGASAGDVDGFVLRAREVVSMNPTFEWVRVISGINHDVPEDIAIDGASNLVVVGYTASAANFGHGTTTNAGFDDAFLMNLDRTTGAVGAATQFGTSGADTANRIVALPGGDMAVAGYFSAGTLAVGGRSVSGTGPRNLFVAALAASTFTAHWAIRAEGDVRAGGLGIAGTRLLVSGTFVGALALDRGQLTNAFDHSAFIASLDAASGSTVFARATQGGTSDRSGGVATGNDGTIVWEIDHDGFVGLPSSSLGGSDPDIAMVVVTP